MAQVDRRAAEAGEFFGKDVFLKSFTRSAGNIDAAQFTQLVSSVQNENLSILKIGEANGAVVNMIVEGGDELASDAITGYVIADIAF